MNKERLWTKDFITVSVINFLVFLIHFLLMVTIASYAVDKFHASTSIAGLVAGIFIIGALIGRLGTGRIIEDIGSKRVLIVSTIIFYYYVRIIFCCNQFTTIDHHQTFTWDCFWGSKHGYGNNSRPNYSSKQTTEKASATTV